MTDYSRLTSYCSSYSPHHKEFQLLRNKPIWLEEKIDGSQISFMVQDGELLVKSRRVLWTPEHIELGQFDKNFKPAIDYLLSIKEAIRPGWRYRGEYLRKPRHNAITYGRIPTNHIIIYDIETELDGEFLSPFDRHLQSAFVGLEAVPVLYSEDWLGIYGPKNISIDAIEWLIKQAESIFKLDSWLGGMIEGVVVKTSESCYDPGKKQIIGKIVREEFKELNQQAQRDYKGPSKADIIQHLGASLANEARIAKAFFRLRDDGSLEEGMRAVPQIMKELWQDILKEEQFYIKEQLEKWAMPQLEKIIKSQVPKWLKEHLKDAE